MHAIVPKSYEALSALIDKTIDIQVILCDEVMKIEQALLRLEEARAAAKDILNTLKLLRNLRAKEGAEACGEPPTWGMGC